MGEGKEEGSEEGRERGEGGKKDELSTWTRPSAKTNGLLDGEQDLQSSTVPPEAMPATSEMVLPMAAAAIVDRPIVAPRLFSIELPALSMIKLSRKPKTTKGTATLTLYFASCAEEGVFPEGDMERDLEGALVILCLYHMENSSLLTTPSSCFAICFHSRSISVDGFL